MPRPKGFHPPPEAGKRISDAHAFRNALVEAGEEVLRTAAEGDPERVSAVAQERLAAVRRDFAGSSQITRLMPAIDEDKEDK